MNNSYSLFIIHTLQAVLDLVLEFLLSISTCSKPSPKIKENVSYRKTPKYWNVILIFLAQCTSLWNWLWHSNCWKSPSLLLKIFSKSHFFNWTQTKLVLSPVKCALSWADTKMSNQYFLFIFLCYEKQRLISEKFETNFVKQFLPWNPTPRKPSSALLGS